MIVVLPILLSASHVAAAPQNTTITLNSINSGDPLIVGQTYGFSGGVTPNTIPDGNEVTLNMLNWLKIILPSTANNCPNYGEGTGQEQIATAVTYHDPSGNVVFNGTFTAPAAGTYPIWARFQNLASGYAGSESECQPITVNAVTATTITTEIHQIVGGVHNVVTSVPLGSVVHDSASVGTQVGSFVIGGSVTYNFYTGSACSGDPTWFEVRTMSGGLVPESSATAALGVGQYRFQVVYSGDPNYATSTSECEVLAVVGGGQTVTQTVTVTQPGLPQTVTKTVTVSLPCNPLPAIAQTVTVTRTSTRTRTPTSSVTTTSTTTLTQTTTITQQPGSLGPVLIPGLIGAGVAALAVGVALAASRPLEGSYYCRRHNVPAEDPLRRSKRWP